MAQSAISQLEYILTIVAPLTLVLPPLAPLVPQKVPRGGAQCAVHKDRPSRFVNAEQSAIEMLRVHIQKSIQLCAAHARDAGHLIVPSKKGLSLHIRTELTPH
eukprot:scaffold20363_cov128-Isochrysis_galbana.AAC.2